MSDWRGTARGNLSLGSMIGQLIGNMQDIIRGEVALAKQEIKDELKEASVAGGLLAGAGAMGLLGAIFAGQTLTHLLALLLPRWLASLLVTLGCLVGAAAFFQAGRERLRNVDPTPRRTIASTREDKAMVNRTLRPDGPARV